MRLRAAIVCVSAVGIGIAAYLTIVHYANTAPICTTGGCEKVQHSSYAELGGVPVALLGLLAYIAIVATALRGGVAYALAGTLLALVGVAFSGYLLWAQLARIHAICQWCLGNDAVVTVVAVLCIVRLLTEPPAESSPAAAARALRPRSE